MKTIWKFPVIFTPELGMIYGIEMPKGAKVLRVADDPASGFPAMWALVDTDAEVVRRKFKVYGTGHELDEEHQNYIGSANCRELYSGTKVFVWHIYEVF